MKKIIGKKALLVTEQDGIHPPTVMYHDLFPATEERIKAQIDSFVANAHWYKKAYVVRIEKEIDLEELYEKRYGEKRKRV